VRHSSGAMSSSLIFFGQGGELFMGEEPLLGESSADRIKSLLGDSSADRAGLVRRRIVRRPLSGYQAQPMVFSERDSASPSLASGDPLSEMLMHLAASRKEQSAGRSSGGDSSVSASMLSGLAQLASDEGIGSRIPHASDSSAASAQLRSRFLQELMLAALSDDDALSQMGPLTDDYD